MSLNIIRASRGGCGCYGNTRRTTGFNTCGHACANGCSLCTARTICSMSGFGHTRCNKIPVIRTTAVAYQSAETELSIPVLTLPSDRFILDVEQTLNATNTEPIGLDEDNEATVVPVYDRHGNYVRTDSLANTILARSRGSYPCVESSIYRFRAVLGSDPVRVNILDCLAPTNYVAPSTPVPTTPEENASADSGSSEPAVAKAAVKTIKTSN